MSIKSPSSLVTDSLLSQRDTYLNQLLNQVTLVKTTGWLQDLRDRAAVLVQEQTFPTTRDEEWRFTDLSSLLQVNFQAVSTQLSAMSLSSIDSLILPEAANSRLVFVNGVYAPELSAVNNLLSGVFIGNLAQLPENYRSRIGDYLGKQSGKEEVFTALNTASLNDAAIIWIPKNIEVETPIHLLFISTASETPVISAPRCLVVGELGSSVTLIEDYWHHENTRKTEDAVYLTNAVTEIWLGENSQVNHTRVERDSLAAFHIGKTAVVQAKDSRYSCNAITLGAKLSRHNLEIFQTGEQTETTLNGLTVIALNQLADTHSAIALNHPYGTTRQLHKCVVGDRAHAVFNGKVFVPKPAQLTDARQLNRNLLLSPKARVDTKPQLEITADNVKCSHGATVSQLEDEELFYLQSRGINQNNARNLLINAFAAEIINHIPLASLRETLTTAIQTSHA